MINYNKIKRFALITVILGVVTSCTYDRDIDQGAKPAIPKVENLQVELVGDTAMVTWEQPSYEGNLTTRVNYNGGIENINTSSEFEYGIIDVNTDYYFTVKLYDDNGNYSLGETVSLFREGPQAVTNFRGVQEGTNVNLSWTLPDENISGIRLRVNSEEINLPADATSYTYENEEYGTYRFRINAMDADGNSSPSKYLNFTVGTTKIGYLGTAPDISSINDDDEAASAAWLFENYPDAEYIQFSDIEEGIDLSEFRVLWWHYDNSNNNPGLPAEATSAEVVSAIAEFHKNGGALLLNTHAVPYLWTIGRMTTNFGKVIGAGEGFDNPDTWGVNVNIGRVHDKFSHPLYEGLNPSNIDGRKVIPLIGPGWKEDHNYVFVDLPSYYGFGNGEEAAYAAISEESNLNILGTWDGIADYFMMGIFETLPNEEFDGTAIGIGLGSFEWNQNNGENQYQDNIEVITKNALDYLRVQ